MFNETIKKINWNNNVLEISAGKFASQAHGAVMVRMGGSAVLCTAVSAKSMREGIGFFPLTVQYQEKSYAAGKIPGGFFKRDGKASDREVLISRLIDRPLRPLFHPHFFHETQIICTVFSYDPNYNTDILGIIGASAALAISGIPYLDIIAAGRVGYIDGQFILNPSSKMLNDSKLDLVVAGTASSVMMVESEADNLTEHQMIEAVKFGHQKMQPVIDLIKELKAEIGKPIWKVTELFPAALKTMIKEEFKDDIIAAFALKNKQEKNTAVLRLNKSVKEKFTQAEYPELQIQFALEEVIAEIFRRHSLESKVRIDGRKDDEIRPINCETSLFNQPHGSAFFARGQTQTLVIATLGTTQDEQIIDSLEEGYKESFLLNYVFPPYSVGEVQPLKAPSRREIGHSKLAWRALKSSLPDKSEFPYTIRIVSEVISCNGSSSMATICGASMAMMDAGVPLKAPVAGIAMGLIKEGKEVLILSDIIGDEDHFGDMDFKVAGSKDGITALQMDIKVEGISYEIMESVLIQARTGRFSILEEMNAVINTPNPIGENVPLVISFMVDKDKIREIIGVGGKIIKDICDTTGAKIDIADSGEILVSAIGKANLDAAVKKIQDIVIEPKIGEVFEGTVVKILEAGAFINYLGKRDGFVHISEIAHEHVESVASVLLEGQKVKVKLIGFERGKGKLTIKNAETDSNSDSTKRKAFYSENSTGPEKKFEKKEGNSSGKKKWKSKSKGQDQDIKERKYFN